MAAMCPSLVFSSAAFFARPLDETCRWWPRPATPTWRSWSRRTPRARTPPAWRRSPAAYGLTIGAIHAPSLLLTRKVWGTDPVGKIYRSIEVAEEAEIPLVVMHPPYRWQRRYRRWLDEAPAGAGAAHRRDGRDREHVPGPDGRTRHALPREPGPRRTRGAGTPRARHQPRCRRRARSQSRCGAGSGHGFGTCTCRTTRARGGIPTSPRAKASSISTGSCVSWPRAATRDRSRWRSTCDARGRTPCCCRNGWWRCGNGAKRGSGSGPRPDC